MNANIQTSWKNLYSMHTISSNLSRPICAHVKNTCEIGTFKIISHSYADGVWRLRWKVVMN